MKNKRGVLKKRAAAKAIPFSLSAKHLRKILAVKKCPICSVSFSNKANSFNSRSIDRIVPEKGYVEKNTAVICRKCNCQKSNWDLGTLKSRKKFNIAKWVAFKMLENADLTKHIKVLSVKDNAITIEITKEFKEYFKHQNGLKRWSNKRFERWVVQALSEYLSHKDLS